MRRRLAPGREFYERANPRSLTFFAAQSLLAVVGTRPPLGAPCCVEPPDSYTDGRSRGSFISRPSPAMSSGSRAVARLEARRDRASTIDGATSSRLIVTENYRALAGIRAIALSGSSRSLTKLPCANICRMACVSLHRGGHRTQLRTEAGRKNDDPRPPNKKSDQRRMTDAELHH